MKNSVRIAQVNLSPEKLAAIRDLSPEEAFSAGYSMGHEAGQALAHVLRPHPLIAAQDAKDKAIEHEIYAQARVAAAKMLRRQRGEWFWWWPRVADVTPR